MIYALISEVTVGVGLGIGVLTLLGLLAKAALNGFRKLDALQDSFQWVRDQMQANGTADMAGNTDKTLRDVVDAQTIYVGALQEGHNKLEATQRDQCQRIAKIDEKLTNHLIAYGEQTKRVNDYLRRRDADD